MRLLVCHPGSPYATGDVFSGMVPKLHALGVEIHEYDLDARLEMVGKFLELVWQERGSIESEKYTTADVVYGASKDILERALRWEVDGVLIFSGMFMHPDALILLKRAHVRTAMLLSESPYDSDKEARVLPLVDVAWTNERSSVRTLRQANPNVNYMPHAYNPAIHYPMGGDHHSSVFSCLAQSEHGSDMTGAGEDDVPSHDVVFVGSMFEERVELLSQIDWTGIDLGLYGNWDGLPDDHMLRQYVVRGVIDNRYAAALYRKAKIGLNLYRESMGWGEDAPRITHAESMNPRTLELAACGCFQISQSRAEITETFGIWIPTFEDVAELNQLIHHYVNAPQERAMYARKALRAVQGQTFAARAQTILDDLARAEWPVRQLVAV